MATNYLVLEDGTVLEGVAFGYEKAVSGEVVFTTAMGGYQENITDPSNCGQILVSTYPLVGDYGITDSANQSDNVWIAGLVVKEYCDEPSPMYNGRKIDDFLKEHKIPGISGIDTREITLKTRENGTMKGAIVYDKANIDAVIEDLKKMPEYPVENLVSKVSCKCDGVADRIQSSGSAMFFCSDDRAKKRFIASFSAAESTPGLIEANNGVPLFPSNSAHCMFSFMEIVSVTPTQSASASKNVLCWHSRNARVFTPILQERSHSRPLVSSPIRARCISPAPRCPMVLHPKISVKLFTHRRTFLL